MTPFRRPLSIRTRLALIYTGLLAAALIAFGTGVFLVLREELERSFDAGLLANAEHAAGAFAQDVDAEGRLRPTARLVDQFASTGGRVVVLDQTGTELVDSAPPGARNCRSPATTSPRPIVMRTSSASLPPLAMSSA